MRGYRLKGDEYSIIKGKRIISKELGPELRVEGEAFNHNGTLNQQLGTTMPTAKIERLHIPARIIETIIKPGSENSVNITFDEGWQITFRIHNASSKVEPSLKFDIKLIGVPTSLYINHIAYSIDG